MQKYGFSILSLSKGSVILLQAQNDRRVFPNTFARASNFNSGKNPLLRKSDGAAAIAFPNQEMLK
ncbi:MAG: hypothetical protein COZ31_10510 [Nitrospirae bacterium CG_4_10_14_3_um_filter_44_29]|nr:MAG: hypothetical protein AUJ60_02950 [Nitrospirae bacterium CG1_02_44_142]PIP70990.1 MAG: hypothetical protein COW90_02415 [Nitrospirae bacterium CG22_combo_CG10-13_8_21_14_all_44_11]PIV41434.1 MAG: hypothetical protein COS28_05150 [Nitrospirae bacterium CG02_land_8_20_14_3_00_44_33]PIV65836.1 MAG: hypothetical protein COS10_09220 [Nitrospirae bacterium CG01_land_8_20_14_3_00_44_22]PIW90458.1 MAG: hypothetical protein COZ93_01530 [Nitrospirae bacterium CG_4_8_14_3_um_filter_44_28]PIX87415.